MDKEPSCVATSSDENSSGSASVKPILLADAGYNSGPNLSHAQASSFDSYIAMNERQNESETVGSNKDNGNKEDHYSNEDFDYNDENDTWICPQGEELENYGEKIQEGKHITMYTGKLEACLQCPSRAVCLTTKLDQRNGYRSVVDDGHNISRKEMKEKMALPEAQRNLQTAGNRCRAGFWTDQIQSKFYEVLCARSVKSKNAIHFSLYSP